MPPRNVLQNDNLQVPRLVLALRNSQGNVDRASDARWPYLLASDDPSGLTGLPVSTLVVDADGATLSQVDTDGTTLKTFRTTAAGGTQPDLIFSTITTLTIASGIVTATQGQHALAGEGGNADTLTSILGLAAGELVLLRAADAADAITIQHGVGANLIACPFAKDIVLTQLYDWALGVNNGTQTTIIAFSTAAANAGGAGALIGLLSALTTTDKASVVAAINEVQPKAAVVTRETTTVGAKVVLPEGTDNGVHTLTLQGPASLAASRTVTFPDTDVDLTTIATHTGQIAAIGAENTDGQIQIPLLAGLADGGTWTKAVTSGGLVSVARTAADAPDSFWVEIPVPSRTTASKGIKPTGLRVNYSVATADVADVRFELWKVTQGADNAARTAAVLFGEDDADYDGDHNTAAERGDDTAAPELHLAIVTDAGTPAYLGAGETLMLRCYVDGDAGAAGVVTVTSAVLLFSETLVDLA